MTQFKVPGNQGVMQKSALNFKGEFQVGDQFYF